MALKAGLPGAVVFTALTLGWGGKWSLGAGVQQRTYAGVPSAQYCPGAAEDGWVLVESIRLSVCLLAAECSDSWLPLNIPLFLHSVFCHYDTVSGHCNALFG